ncbi:MAG: nuclear transport factor 2 family protein, partial [Gammaproteobacteria bacterium]|nr:nuclear transport factor 2 family protein [Gammaproteobacteria bacterium]
KMLLVEFTEAVIAGPEKLAPMLAPEYQIMRSNGVGYNREEYLKRGVGALSIKPVFSHQDLVVTVADKVMVVRYLLEVDETIEGVPISKRAPRLTVFRLIDDRWRVVSHSNFARHDG